MKRKSKLTEIVEQVEVATFEDNFEKLSLSQCREALGFIKVETNAILLTQGVGQHMSEARRNFLMASVLTTILDSIEQANPVTE